LQIQSGERTSEQYTIGKKVKCISMLLKKNENYIEINENDTISLVNQKFISNKNKLKFVIGICFKKNRSVQGILTLGDLRRALEKRNYNEKINKFINKKFLYIKKKTPLNEYNNYINKILKKSIIKNEILILDQKKKLFNILPIQEIRNNIIYKKICIIGLGHVGLPLAVYIANKNFPIVGYDKDQKKIKTLKNKIFFYEKNIEELKNKSIKNGNLKITSNISHAKGQVYIICIGTELRKNKISNINLKNCLYQLSKSLNIGDLVIIRGTMYLGQTNDFVKKIIEKKTNLIVGRDFYLSYCPERLVEGNAMEELEKLPQIISGVTDECKKKTINFWSMFCNNIIDSNSPEESEIIKLASNCYRDLIFAFSNDLTRIASAYNLEINDIITKANFGYERNNFKKPSPGVGGSCLTKDPILFSILNKKNKYTLGKISRFINNNSIKEIANKIVKIKKKYSLKEFKVLIFGVTYKGYPETSDIRSSTAIDLANLLKKKKINYKFFDITLQNFKTNLGNLSNKFIDSENEIKNFDLIIIMNNHIQSEEKIINNIRKTNNKKFIFDCWSVINKDKIEDLNYKYLSLSKNYF
jgi:UDP-N-acetyl-D-mannosaminuronic acid dehydrogenase